MIRTQLKFAQTDYGHEDLRKIRRWEADNFVVCNLQGQWDHFSAKAKDISCSGLGFVTFKELVPGQKLNIVFKLIENEDIELSGEVAWIRSEDLHFRVGIHFFNTTDKVFISITSFIRSRYPVELRNYFFGGLN